MTSFKVHRYKRNNNLRKNKSDFMKGTKTENNNMQKNNDSYRDTDWNKKKIHIARDTERDRKGKGT